LTSRSSFPAGQLANAAQDLAWHIKLDKSNQLAHAAERQWWEDFYKPTWAFANVSGNWQSKPMSFIAAGNFWDWIAGGLDWATGGGSTDFLLTPSLPTPLNATDQFFAGMANGVTMGASTLVNGQLCSTSRVLYASSRVRAPLWPKLTTVRELGSRPLEFLHDRDCFVYHSCIAWALQLEARRP
jgi:hypothetical protein